MGELLVYQMVAIKKYGNRISFTTFHWMVMYINPICSMGDHWIGHIWVFLTPKNRGGKGFYHPKSSICS